MLVRLFGENFGVFRDRFELSFEATALGTDEERGYFEVPLKGESDPLRLLRMVAIYGPNASGKSTIIRAADALWDLAVTSGPRSQEGESVSEYAPFKLSKESRSEPSTLGCEVLVGDRKHGFSVVEYSVSFTSVEIVEEHIVEHRGERSHTWMNRSRNNIRLYDRRLPGQMSLDLGGVTRSNATAISVAAQLNQKPLLGVFRALSDSLRTITDSGLTGGCIQYSVDRLHRDELFRNWSLQRLLMPADIGIVGVSTRKQELPIKLREAFSRFLENDDLKELEERIEPVFTHRGVDGDYNLEFDTESSGTRKIMSLAGPWFDVVTDKLTVFVDELSASLHPTLLISLLHSLNAPPSMPESQLAFTVHDPTPLEGVLRRDQVYFTEKNDQGMAALIPLIDFRERKEHNIRKRYLEGRYGGVPRSPDFSRLFEEWHGNEE